MALKKAPDGKALRRCQLSPMPTVVNMSDNWIRNERGGLGIVIFGHILEKTELSLFFFVQKFNTKSFLTNGTCQGRKINYKGITIMDNLPPSTSNTAFSVSPSINDSRKPWASSRKKGKSARRTVQPAESPEQRVMRQMKTELQGLKSTLRHLSRTDPGASWEQSASTIDSDVKQVTGSLKKCSELKEECLKVMFTCQVPTTKASLMKVVDSFDTFKDDFDKLAEMMTHNIALQIVKQLNGVSSGSDGESVSNNMADDMADDIVENLLKKIDQVDKPESANILERVLECFSLYFDPKAKSLKKNEQSGQKLFFKLCELFARSLSKVLDHYQELDSEVLSSVQKIMEVVEKNTCGQGNSLHLQAVLNQLNKQGILDPKASFTGKERLAGHVIKACVAQLENLNKIIGSKAQNDKPFTVELLQKDKFVSQLNALRPYFPEGDLYIEFIHGLVVDHVDHNWFALLYALAHYPADALSGPWREEFSQRLEHYHPEARTMVDALFTGNHGQVPDATVDKYPVLWLKAFILNKQGDHRGACEAISQSERCCRALELKPDVRLQLEILRIKLQSQQLASDFPRLSPEELKTMKERANNLITHPQAFWTEHEHALLRQLQAELATVLLQYTPTVNKSVIPAGPRTVKDAPDEPGTPNAEVGVTMPALPQSEETRVKELCKNLITEIRGWQGSNRPEPLTPDDSYQVMGPYGKTLSATETMQKDYWNAGILQLLAGVSAHRADGDILEELSCYRSILADATRKRTIGIYRLTLELSWTIMRYVNGEYGAADLTDHEKGELLDLSWQFLKQSVCLAMRRSSPWPEQASDQELVDTVVQWLQLLKNDPQAKKEMEFFMRCALGSTAGHIHGFLAEIFPRQKQHSDSARFFFKAKSLLQPDYQKPVCEEGRDTRQRLMRENQQKRWL